MKTLPLSITVYVLLLLSHIYLIILLLEPVSGSVYIFLTLHHSEVAIHACFFEQLSIVVFFIYLQVTWLFL